MRRKRNNSAQFFAWMLTAVMLLSACKVTRYLKPGQSLYTGAGVKVEAPAGVNKKQVRKQLEALLKPVPNQSILGMRIKLWFYFKAGEEPKGKFRKFLRNKLGEKPVLFDPGIPLHMSELLSGKLANTGYFQSQVSYSVHTRKLKTHVVYQVKLSEPYTLRQVRFSADSSFLSTRIGEAMQKTLLKTGSRYDLSLLKAERQRIDVYLKENGFYFFNPDYLMFKADSSKGDRQVDLLLVLKADAPKKALTEYRLREVYVFPSHRVRDSAAGKKTDTALVDGLHYVSRAETFKPRTITSSVFLRPGDRYNRKFHNLTLSRLMGMGVFHYANIRFSDSLSGNRGLLDAYIYLTPMKKRSLQLELQLVTKSNNYTGPALILGYRNRNLLKGAELFVFNLNGNFETQFTGIQKGFNSYEVGANTQLYLPRFLTPVVIRNVSSTYVPRTKFDLGFRNLNRVLYFNMNSFNFSYGYTWKESQFKEHEFNPVAVNFARLMNTTAAFDELLNANPFLRRSFEQQFTLGGYYAFTYNSAVNTIARQQYYFNGIVDVSGNMANLVQSLVMKRRPDEETPFKILGYRYSQYAKFAADGRYYYTFNRNSKLASRLMAGIGIPYGNSAALPYIKQFFSGGSSSIRAFLPRTVGPGTYVTPDSLLRRRFLDQAGDVKLEANLEYRFTVISVLKGALFLDAGNVWLSRKSHDMPGGEFIPSRFYKQLAVGSGFGLRLDITYFVLRFDLGVALRKPHLPDGQRWVIRHIDFSEKNWRRQNIVLNIAIGYPF